MQNSLGDGFEMRGECSNIDYRGCILIHAEVTLDADFLTIKRVSSEN